MNQIRIKLELIVETPLNVSKVREAISKIEDTNILNDIATLVDAPGAAQLRVYSASYNTHFGRKPE